MRGVKRAVILTGLTAAGAYLLYTYGLSDRAKTGLKRAARGVKDAYEKINDTIEGVWGQVIDEDDLPNRAATEAQWEYLGL